MNRVESNPQATQVLETEVPADIGGIQGLHFTKVDGYTTFAAEYALEGDDIVFHFFLPPELEGHLREPKVLHYWKRVFPEVLEPVVYEIFKVQSPQVQAAYVGDFGVNSWWLRAHGFASRLDPDGFCTFFFEELDKALDASKKT